MTVSWFLKVSANNVWYISSWHFLSRKQWQKNMQCCFSEKSLFKTNKKIIWVTHPSLKCNGYVVIILKWKNWRKIVCKPYKVYSTHNTCGLLLQIKITVYVIYMILACIVYISRIQVNLIKWLSNCAHNLSKFSLYSTFCQQLAYHSLWSAS